jgi:peptidoglycan L-alanyl-D-glutamate endopeptidase CwlK
MAQLAFATWAREGLLLKPTQTLRTYAEQAVVWAQGRTTPGLIVTHAPPGYSWHQFGRAYDIAQIGHDPYPADEAFWLRVGEIGEGVGLEWGGRWKHADRPHFEHRGGLTLAQARAIHDQPNLA